MIIAFQAFSQNLEKRLLEPCLCVCPSASNSSIPTERILIKVDI